MANGYIKRMHDFILKILSGPMFGVDVGLPDNNVHLFFCDSATIEENHTGSVYQYAINTLLIPCALGANEKIILHLNRPKDSDGVAEVMAQRIPFDVLDDETPDKDEDFEGNDDDETWSEDSEQSFDLISVPFNQPVTVGHAVFALRHTSEEWSQEVTQYYYPLPEHNKDAGTQSNLVAHAEEKRTSFFKWASCGILTVAAIAVLAAILLPNEIVTLKDALSPVNPDISKITNGEIYVMSKTQPESVWVESALRKSNLNKNNIIVAAESDELVRMKKLLVEHFIPFFDVKFSSAFTIDLMLSQERSADDRTIDERIKSLLTAKFPYLANIHIQRISDRAVLENANQRLKSLGLFSQKDITPNHVTLSVSGEIDDFQLNTLRRQVSEFYEQYGDQYVKFVVNLNEDPLRNRTFKTGADSYVVVPGNHWLYSDITTTY